jgi:hypothetical protein
LAVGDETNVAHRRDRVERSEQHRQARVEHAAVDALVVEHLQPGGRVPRGGVALGVLPGPGHQFLGVVAGGASEDAGAGRAPHTADVPRLVAVVVLGDVVRDPLAPAVGIHAVDPEIGRFEDVGISIDVHPIILPHRGRAERGPAVSRPW